LEGTATRPHFLEVEGRVISKIDDFYVATDAVQFMDIPGNFPLSPLHESFHSEKLYMM
jgi:hypothetical protein